MDVRTPKAIARGVPSALFALLLLYVMNWQVAFVVVTVSNGALSIVGGGLTGLGMLWLESVPLLVHPAHPNTRVVVWLAVVLTIVEALFFVIAKLWWRAREQRRLYGPHVDIGPGGGRPIFRRR